MTDRATRPAGDVRGPVVIYADARARETLGQAAREVARAAILDAVRLEQSDGFDPRAVDDDDPAAIATSWEARRQSWARH